MAKLTKSEFIEKIQNHKAIPDEAKIELLEDISDTIEETDGTNEEAEEWKAKYMDIKEKYIARFSGKDDSEDEAEDEADAEDEAEDDETYVELYEDED